MTHAVCYSIECCLSNGNHPISLCRQCHERRHIDSNHVYQETLIDMWRLSPDVQNHCVEAIISLLRETDNTEEKRIVDSMSDEKKSILVENLDNTTNMVLSLDIDVGRKLLSRYGIYLILGLIEPTSYGPPVGNRPFRLLLIGKYLLGILGNIWTDFKHVISMVSFNCSFTRQ
jgi:hypothetical protein